MIPRPAQYLLRFDDLCPTVSHNRLQRLLKLIEEFGIRPILAVVPDNQDYDLQLSPPNPEFWDRIRALEAGGATIALHGLQHLCMSKGRSLVPLHSHSEFAGVDEETQRQWVHAGLKILRGHGLNPRIWVAPRHGFDASTLRALSQEGIKLLSDGFARVPFTRGGLTWIPQQLWEPEAKTAGLWTICMHSNTASGALVDRLRTFLDLHAAEFTSVDRVLAELKPAPLEPAERLYEAVAMGRAYASRTRKKLSRRLRMIRSRLTPTR
jgi:predicted deacetylase